MLVAGSSALLSVASGGAIGSDADAQDKNEKADNEPIEQIKTAARDRASAPATLPTVTQLNLDLRMRGVKNNTEKSLFTLKHLPSRATGNSLRADNVSSLLRSINAMNGRDNENLFSSSNSYGLQFGHNDKHKNHKGFELAVTSHHGLSRGLQQIGDDTTLGINPLMERRYDLGVRLGYWGFRIDASVVRQDSVLASSYSGIDLGLGYSSSRFETRLSLKAFREGEHLTGFGELDRAIHDVELGAAYHLSAKVSLTGHLRYTDFSSNPFLEQELGFTSQALLLGGRIHF